MERNMLTSSGDIMHASASVVLFDEFVPWFGGGVRRIYMEFNVAMI